MCCQYVCVFMLRVCCIVLLLLLPLLPPVLPASSALFWSSLGHKTTAYLLARACLSLSVCVCMCVCACVYSPLVSHGNRFYLAAVCLFACLPLPLSLLCPLVGLAARSPTFSQSSSHNFIQDKSVYHVLMLLSFYAAFFVPSFYYLFHLLSPLPVRVDLGRP